MEGADGSGAGASERPISRPPQVPERSEGLYITRALCKGRIECGARRRESWPGQGPIRAPLSDSDARDVTEA